MIHCPYCGTNVKEDELYCIKCGKELPNDISQRINKETGFNRLWFYPITMTILLILASGIYFIFLQNQTTQATELYEQGEKNILDENYTEAKHLFESALEHKDSFTQAEISLNFVDVALKIKSKLDGATSKLEESNFQESLTLMNEAESDLKNYNGTAVSNLIDIIVDKRNTIQLEQLKNKIEQDPNIDELKILLWEAEAINNEEAEVITANIRSQIIEYVFSKASDQLNRNHFSDAQMLVDDGLKYAPNSERLLSLKTTIDKEKTAFETAQQERIEQAFSTAAQEQELNENDAIEVNSVSLDSDDQENLVVTGEVNSVATVPINSISVEYAIVTNDDSEILTNEVYVYPDKLYPDENGKFEFTHFDLEDSNNDFEITINKIKWYTE
ncbi:zinc-ribbon domain-containing protein [Virgibacillus byunsanensis]|uniref:Zinc-ribbon domain-containing protein n=1 Tax=Virgibacillus byunsanensis TaxID=570945 RepID=A0ABW3LNH7_9BACI